MRLKRLAKRHNDLFRDIAIAALFFLFAATAFTAGYITGSSYEDIQMATYDIALSGNPINVPGEPIPMPKDRISQDEITVLKDRVIINIDNPQWATFTPTKSMVPFLDAGAHAIQIVPESPEDLQVGDIVSYRSSFVDGIIIHRIIEIGYDDKGWYAIVQGDNNQSPDPERVRFGQIERVLVAIIY
jgi:hypothetical protein